MIVFPGVAGAGYRPGPDVYRRLRDPRLLLIDDNPAIHEDIRKILDRQGQPDARLSAMAADLFDEAPAARNPIQFQIDSAYQGREGLNLVTMAVAQGRPYAVALVDVRMPPGWDGVETIRHLWSADPDLQIVICTAFSDQSWSEIIAELAPVNGLFILRKPFDSVEIREMVHTLLEG